MITSPAATKVSPAAQTRRVPNRAVSRGASGPLAAQVLPRRAARRGAGTGLLGPGDPGLRLKLFGSQIIGVVMVGAVLGVEPLASTSARTIADAVAPTLTRYLADGRRR